MKTESGTSTIGGPYLAFILVILSFIMTGSNLFSQNLQPKPSRQSSLEAFSKGDYEKAYNEFSELLVLYPKDPLYKYYSGVCLIKLTRDPDKAISLLNQAQQGAAVVRTIPTDAIFWLGRAQQQSGDFASAQESYNLFTDQAGKKAAKELDVPGFIQQCKENKGKTAETEHLPVIPEREIDTPSERGENKVVTVNEIRKNEYKVINGNEMLPVDYDKILSDALEYQYKADSIYKIAEEQNKNLETLGYREKTDLKVKITENEKLAASFQKIADQKYAEVQSMMNATPFNRDNPVKQKEIIIADSTKTVNPYIAIPETEPVLKMDTLKVVRDTIKQKTVIEKPVEQVKEDSVKLTAVKKELVPPVKVTAFDYALFNAEAKPVYAPGEKVFIGPDISDGLIYRIQIAVFRNPVVPSYFKGLSPVYGFRIPGSDKTNYYVGMFRRRADANKALLTVRQKGFKDAFIVSLSGGKPVSAERAALLEKEWGKKPLSVGSETRIKIPADTLPPALSFRVEITRAAKPLKEDIIEGMKKMAGNRGLDSEPLSDGTVVYLVGKFITYESAEEFAGLLIRNGYRDAKVAAWLGKKEIPVETARQLFEKLE